MGTSIMHVGLACALALVAGYFLGASRTFKDVRVGYAEGESRCRSGRALSDAEQLDDTARGWARKRGFLALKRVEEFGELGRLLRLLDRERVLAELLDLLGGRRG